MLKYGFCDLACNLNLNMKCLELITCLDLFKYTYPVLCNSHAVAQSKTEACRHLELLPKRHCTNCLHITAESIWLQFWLARFFSANFQSIKVLQQIEPSTPVEGSCEHTTPQTNKEHSALKFSL